MSIRIDNKKELFSVRFLNYTGKKIEYGFEYGFYKLLEINR